MKGVLQLPAACSYVTPNKIPKKSFSKLCKEKHNKELRKSPQRRTGKALHNLEE
jgi:hypothetical protein